MTDRLDGIHALITGAASGIGAACARRMARDGAQLLLADLNGDGAKTLADELGHASVRADVTRAADIERMRQQTPIAGSELRGKLIQTASIAAYRGGQAYMVHYAASKAGVVSITRTAAQVLAPHGITSNCICPGVVDTPMWKKIDAEWAEIEGWEIGEAWKRRISLIPLGRPEVPEDVAGVVSFLASRDSDYMTGQAVNV